MSGAEGEAAGYRVVLSSLGRGGVSHLPILRRLRPAPEPELARMLLQAPTELVVLPERSAAREVCDLLDRSGLETCVEEADVPFEAGTGEFDVAVHVIDVSRMADAIARVAALLGIDPVQAREMLCAAPPALIGDVSRATVDALRADFEALGAELAASQASTARFDVVVTDCPPRVRERVRQVAAAAERDVLDEGSGTVLVVDLDRPTAREVAETVAATSAQAKVIDRRFQRFDVRLEACPSTPAALDRIASLGGMPPDIAPEVVRNVPIVLVDDVGRDAAEDALLRLEEVGARAVAEMTTLRRPEVVIDRRADPGAVEHIVRAVVDGHDLAPDAAGWVVPTGPGMVRARWLVHQLGTVGVSAEIRVP